MNSHQPAALALPGGTRLRNHFRVVGIEENAKLGVIQILLVFDAGSLGDLVGVIKHDSEIADASDTGF